MQKLPLVRGIVAGLLLTAPLAAVADYHFDLESSFLVCDNKGDDCASETSSEIIAASADGNTLVYSDSPGLSVGLIDISSAATPMPLGFIDLSAVGEPTAVAVFEGSDGSADAEWIVVGVNTSPDFDANFNGDHSGWLYIYDLAECVADAASCAPVAMFDLGGQPDSVAVSPDGTFVGVAVENERDEDACHLADGTLVPEYWDEEDDCLDDVNELFPPETELRFGVLPQPNPGEFVVFSGTDGAPASWTQTPVALTGLPGLIENSDPEPEFVHINSANKAMLSLQENNAFVVIDLASATVDSSHPAGGVDLVDIDTNENRLIELVDTQDGRLREPDGLTWIGTDYMASANEGDMDGGSRGFTIFEVAGASDGATLTVVYESGETFDHLQAMHGHYPEERSENKGNEPEAVTYVPGFGDMDLLMVASERSSTVAVYDVSEGLDDPQWVQFLPAVMGPESVIALPDRGLIIIANEVDDEARSMVNIYQWEEMPDGPDYPTVVATEDSDNPGLPIPFGALSGLTAGAAPGMLYAVHDSFYKEARIFHIDATAKPAMITGYTPLYGLPQDDIDAYDLEGIAVRADGGFWLVSEGTGNIDDLLGRDFEDENLLIRVAADGEIMEEVSLPAEVADKQHRFGFEGVAVTGSGAQERVFVAFQREWLKSEPDGIVRIGEYNPQTGNWKFHWYPLDPREADSGWVGLSEIVAVGPRAFLVLERDNQGGPFAAIKRIYHFDLNDGRDANLQDNRGNGKGQSYPTVRKTLVHDLLPDYQAINGWVPDKPEGMVVDAAGDVFVVTDNDGVDDATGQTWLFNIGSLD
jgi:hypothetical protein